ncbi:MAG: methionine--tRNA ligase, partial [Candidatus Babeliales bacterium]
MQKNKFYITTPIYYVTAKPHLGTLYSTIMADVVARWNRLKGNDTFFLTGTDEHGQKIEQAAAQAGKAPKAFVDSFIDAYKDMWKKYECDYNGFIRTTDTYHVNAVQQWLKDLIAKGDIYKDHYAGWYCTPCETYLTDADLAKEGQEHPCPSCSRATKYVSEESYFFKLSSYQEKLLDFYKNNPDFIVPKERFNEVIRFVEGGLKDLSVSRTTIKWGIPFPGDAAHVTYVWADALNNYITAVGYGDSKRAQEFSYWWPADLHVMGKDIVRFHAVYWPAFLMASGLPLPKQLLVHGWIQVDGKKMSKSLGNVVDPEELYTAYGPEPVRYYLMRQIPINQDGNFTYQDFQQHIAADLANDLGNLLNRMVALALKYDAQKIAAPACWSDEAQKLHEKAQKVAHEYAEHMEKYQFHTALSRLWQFIGEVNTYFHAQEPWNVAKSNPEQFKEIIAATSNSLRMIATMLWPIMPTKMKSLLAQLGQSLNLGIDSVAHVTNDQWNHAFNLAHGDILFIKPEPKEEIMEKREEKNQEPQNIITIDDLMKVELRVGTIKECALVEKSDKLYRMQIDFGAFGLRQIFAG